jgi:tetratricopeptide (TPR) repeat protein
MAQRAIASDSGFALGYAALGDAYWSQYQSDKDPALVGKATDAVMQALRIDPNQAPVHYSLGNMRYLTGHLDEAASSLRRALALQPDSDDAHRLLGRVIADQGHVDDAVKEIGEAIKIRPNYWNNHYTLGFVLYRTGRYAPAREAFRRASELQPASAIAFQMIGTTSYILGEIDTAIGNYEHSVRVGPTAAAYANLAYVYYYAKRYDEALAAYSESLRRSPKSVVNHRNIGDVYERLGRLGEARKAYEEAIRLANEQLTVNPRDVVTIGTLAICEAKLQRRSAAERHAAEAVSLAPTNADAWLRSASVHAILKQTQAGLDDLRRAIANGLEPRRAREDDTLQPLRTRPEFEQLLRAAEQTKVNAAK